MGLEIVVPAAETRLATIVAKLADAGLHAMVVMVDGALLSLAKPLPETWLDARLRTPAGTVTLARRGDDVAVVVFGNADEALRQAQAAVARALAP